MDYDIILRFVVALVFVLGLIGLLSWAARRFGFGGRVPLGPGRQRRTMVVEATAVDAKRRLVLVRRDNVEHLVLLGPTADLVIEQGIAVPGGQTEPDTPGNPRRREGAGSEPARNFVGELKALAGIGEPSPRTNAAPEPATDSESETSPSSSSPSAPKASLSTGKRRPGAPIGAPSLRDAPDGGRKGRSMKTKLSQLKPERLRLGKQPTHKP